MSLQDIHRMNIKIFIHSLRYVQDLERSNPYLITVACQYIHVMFIYFI